MITEETVCPPDVLVQIPPQYSRTPCNPPGQIRYCKNCHAPMVLLIKYTNQRYWFAHKQLEKCLPCSGFDVCKWENGN